jgi:hypothetical protein
VKPPLALLERTTSAAVFFSVLCQLRNQNALDCARFAQCLQKRPGILLGLNCAVMVCQCFVLSLDRVGDFLRKLDSLLAGAGGSGHYTNYVTAHNVGPLVT